MMAVMERDPVACLESWSQELLSRAERVRKLIGSAHWLSDGHHKEELLRQFLTRHLPPTFRISRGFICPSGAAAKVSPEVDVLITDSTKELPWFVEGGVVIAPPSCVLAQIHVKTEYSKKEVKSVLAANLATGLSFEENRPINELWSGAVFFAGNKIRNGKDCVETYCECIRQLGRTLKGKRRGKITPMHLPDCIAILSGPVLLTRKHEGAATTSGRVEVQGWDCGDLSVAVLLSHFYSAIRSAQDTARKRGEWEQLLEAVNYKHTWKQEVNLG